MNHCQLLPFCIWSFKVEESDVFVTVVENQKDIMGNVVIIRCHVHPFSNCRNHCFFLFVCFF